MYPLKFKPVFQKRIWGGQRLRSLLNKALPAELAGGAGGGGGVGESWELADLPPGTVKADSTGAAADGSLSSAIANGPWAGRTLRDVWQEQSGGGGGKGGGHFPLLIKFLDSAQDLSVQVHPDEAYCRSHPGSHLKSEAWYIMHAEPGAKIYKGVKAGVTKEAFRTALQTGQVATLLNAIPVRTGDCHYLPSGTVHALGAGLLVAEVQTPSDTTFRVFDWNRLGADGKPRTLHVEEALACIRFTPPVAEPLTGGAAGGAGAVRLAQCEHFTIDRVEMPRDVQRPLDPALAVWIILRGQGVITLEGALPTAFTRGDTLLLPAGMNGAQVKTVADAAWLDVRVPTVGG
jgi:mannose-6-phosphate isomerase